MSDNLPSTPPLKQECAVINLDQSINTGIHWICYWYENNKACIFDSFGGVPRKSLIEYLNPNNTIIEYNSDRIQHFDDVISGHLCIKLLKFLSDGNNFHQAIERLKLDYLMNHA
jgi:hypothetical protein